MLWLTSLCVCVYFVIFFSKLNWLTKTSCVYMKVGVRVCVCVCGPVYMHYISKSVRFSYVPFCIPYLLFERILNSYLPSEWFNHDSDLFSALWRCNIQFFFFSLSLPIYCCLSPLFYCHISLLQAVITHTHAHAHTSFRKRNTFSVPILILFVFGYISWNSITPIFVVSSVRLQYHTIWMDIYILFHAVLNIFNTSEWVCIWRVPDKKSQ